MISPINIYAANMSTPIVRSAPVGPTPASSISTSGDSSVVNISPQAAALSAASQSDKTSQFGRRSIVYPDGVPASLQAKLNQVLNNPNVSDAAKGDIIASMVWSPLEAQAHPEMLPQADYPDFSSPKFDAQAFVDQMVTAFAKSGDMAASHALKGISA